MNNNLNEDKLKKTIESLLSTIDEVLKVEPNESNIEQVFELINYTNGLLDKYSKIDSKDCSIIIRKYYYRLLINSIKREIVRERKAKLICFLRDAHKYSARDFFEDFVIYYEWDLSLDEKFYEPRMEILRGYAYYLNELHHKRVEIVIANLPSGAGKTYLAKLAEAWSYGIDNKGTCLSLCSNDDVVKGGSRTVIDIIKTPQFGDVFPEMRFDKEDRDYFLQETAGSWKLRDCKLPSSYYAATVRTNVIGIRASKTIHIDDLYADYKEALDDNLNTWYYNRFVTVWRKRFVQNRVPRILITGTMWSPIDFMVKIIDLLEKENKFIPSENFKYCRLSEDKTKVIIQVPALDYDTGESSCKNLWTTRDLEKERNSMDDYLWNCNFQQIPTSPEGLEFSYPNLLVYNEKINEDVNYCKAVIDGTRKSGRDNFVMFICSPRERENTIDWVFKDCIYTKTATSELTDVIIDKIIYNHITELVIESNVDGGLKRLLDTKLKEKGIIYCIIKEDYSTDIKAERITANKGYVLRKIIFPTKELFPLNTEMGKFMSDFTSYNTSGRNVHDDANDASSMFSKHFIQEKIVKRNTIKPIMRPW